MTVNLFINPYTDSRPERQKELTYSQRINAANEYITMIYELPGRATYRDFFDKINTVSGPRDINIIANLDIFFDETLKLAEALRPHEVFALSRWDVTSENPFNIKRYEEPGSQDVWMFRGPITRQIKYCDFPIGKMGCLAGDTIIPYNRGERDGMREIHISELYERFNRISGRWTEAETFTQSLNTDNGVVFKNRILNVLESGVQKTIKLTFDNGETLTLTHNHRVLTKDGYKEAQYLDESDVVIGVGSMQSRSTGTPRKYSKRAYVYVNNHPNGYAMNLKGHTYIRVPRYRLVIEAEMNNLPYEQYVRELRDNDVKEFKYLDSCFEVHHKDGNSQNDALENLEVVTKSQHAQMHGGHGPNFNREYTRDLLVVGKEEAGETMTYDLEMDGPHHNFRANDIFVHNCDNRIAHELQQAGYLVLNPSKSIRCIHYHVSEQRNYNRAVRNADTVVPPPYAFVKSIFLPIYS